MEAKLQQQAPQQNHVNKPNLTGIPTQMKLDFERWSGLSFDDVRVHYNSDKPAQLQALAYTQGTQVYVGPGQERYLKHELGHVVQQKMGIVNRTTFICGLPVNDDPFLERDADTNKIPSRHGNSQTPVIQGRFKFKIKSNGTIECIDTSQPHLAPIRCHYLGVAKNGAHATEYVFINVNSPFEKYYSDGSDIENEYEPVYDLTIDPTATPYLKQNEVMFSGNIIEKIFSRATGVNFEKVRVDPKIVNDNMATRAGMHEILPTDMAVFLFHAADTTQPNSEIIRAVLLGILGGLRTSTDKTFFVAFDPEIDIEEDFSKDSHPVIAHSNAFPIPGKRGGSGTAGQDTQHNIMRELFLKEPIDTSFPEKNIIHIMKIFLFMTAKEEDIRMDNNIAGFYPNIEYRSPPGRQYLEPPGGHAERRNQLASDQGKARELSKRGVRDFARRHREASPSPERLPMNLTANNYEKDNETNAWVHKLTKEPVIKSFPLPMFNYDGSDDAHKYMRFVANISGFFTRPFRNITKNISKKARRAKKPKKATKKATKILVPTDFIKTISLQKTLQDFYPSGKNGDFDKFTEKLREALKKSRARKKKT